MTITSRKAESIRQADTSTRRQHGHAVGAELADYIHISGRGARLDGDVGKLPEQ